MTAPDTKAASVPNDLTEFLYGDKSIRTASTTGETWFVAKDVCEALTISWNGDATLAQLRPEWKARLKLPTSFGDKETILVNDRGVYKLAFRSNKAEAERFTDWLAGEVIPAIRKTGRYDAKAPSATPPRIEAGNANKIRWAKMTFAMATMRLVDLGVDAERIDMAQVVAFGRGLRSIGGPAW
jgi:prophage antirepressor-like protein